MRSIYRSAAGREAIGRWCQERLDRWAVPHERVTLTVSGVRTHAMTAGTGNPVIFVAGTNFNAAASLPLATALIAAGHRVILPDVPGQPGLSSGARGLAAGRLTWYGTWLDGVIEQTAVPGRWPGCGPAEPANPPDEPTCEGRSATPAAG